MTAEFGQYRLVRLMGEGGMAQVWSALRQTKGGAMRCAVKIIRPSHADDPSYRAMFEREARLALALSGHGNVVSVFDVGEHEGRAYLAMELVEGVTLGELAHRVGKPWPVQQAVYVVAGILRALCHIHGFSVDGKPQGIVHRDVTPHNVMISARGEVKLMDFGIAQRADAEPCLGGALGKLAYVPREQVEGEPDQRSDLYSAGAVLYELLDGRRFRWHCADEDAYFLEIYRDRAPSLTRKDVPPAVAAVLRGLLQPDRERRIATAAEALRQLEAWPGFRWSISELEAIYAAAIGPRSRDGAPAKAEAPARPRRQAAVTNPQTGPQSGPHSDAHSGLHSGPQSDAHSGLHSDAHGTASDAHGMASDAHDVASGELRRVARGGRPWDDSSPGAANDSGSSQRAVTAPHSEPVAAAAKVSGEQGAGVPTRRRRTVSVPAWAEDAPSQVVTDELPGPDELSTRLLPAAERNPEVGVDAMERLVTRRHPSALAERDVPSARTSAEIAVTMPQPSRHAPWAAGTDPIAHRLVQPEPGAPVKRRRGLERTESAPLGSVAPRARESAAVHRAASGQHATGVVAGEIVTDDGPIGGPVWRVSTR